MPLNFTLGNEKNGFQLFKYQPETVQLSFNQRFSR